ncbi:J domain-containing protein [Rhodoferax sp.]|uniref:J domain-containing protein n=1 Tax=Rhodoferax sp. TaxID=50421 RepID=UPI0027492E18|nr:J domain-containing protein [Rhodoferax sp.]
MNEPISRFPLQWPTGWKRTPYGLRKYGQFKRDGRDLPVTDGVGRVLAELERLGVAEHDVVVSTNVRTRMDGLPRSGEPKPVDPGACVYWKKTDKDPTRCMAVDRYTEVADNLAAIAATLEAMRAIERHGGAAILDRAFTGFAALPAPAAGQRDWWTVLGLQPDATAEQIRDAHKRMRSTLHPDRPGSGDEARMAELNVARDRGLEGVGQ